MVIKGIFPIGKNISTEIMSLRSCLKITNKYYHYVQIKT
jgi:hypothetical protein